MSPQVASSKAESFFLRHEFLIRRLHSLSGLVPVGAYMVVHLLTNASILNGPGAFQSNVNMIHNLGAILPVVEWGFIFGPLLFHGLVGVWIATTGRSNVAHYRYASNYRYWLQRWSGMLALLFILVHVLHLHGWFHNDWWHRYVTGPLGMAVFRPYNASSTLAQALTGVVWPVFYALGMLSCVYHLANGIWTAGITWGVWTTPKSQRLATWLVTAFGIGLGVVGMSALWGVKKINIPEAVEIEDRMYQQRVETGEIQPNPEKRTH